MNNKNVKNLVMAAFFIGIGLVLPLITGQIKQIGNMLLPMHIPTLLCGLICGWQYGLAVGFILPILRSFLFGMPYMYPNAVAMAFELATYGFVIGFLYSKSKYKCVKALYKCLISAMLAGRIVWGIVEVALLGLGKFTFYAFMAGAFLNSIPGIIIQLVLIPAIMVALNRAKMVPFNKKIASYFIAAAIISLLPAMASAQGLITVNIQEKTAVPIAGNADNDYLFAGYVNKTLYPQKDDFVSSAAVSAREQLSESEKKIYDYLKSEIEKVANGKLASTVFTISRATLDSWGVKTEWKSTELGVDAITNSNVNELANVAYTEFAAGFDVGIILDALLHDCPYDLYWYKKVSEGASNDGGTSYGPLVRARGTEGSETYSSIFISSYSFKFRVANNYQAPSYSANAPAVDTSKTGAATNATDNAKAIVAKYANLSDYKKLKAYRDEICYLTAYNFDAADNTNAISYGDPWQIIYVFDKNSTTNVVCEGYAKAFQYLFDLSSFSGNIKCYTVTGTMGGGTGAGGHMWNIVTMEDGKNYLVDITNSDSGTIGKNGGLFLAGTQGSVSEGYNFVFDAYNSISFDYNTDALTLWGSGTDSILNLNSKGYAYLENVDALTSYKDKLTIKKTYGGVGEANLNISLKSGNTIPKIKVYTIIYNLDGTVKNVLSDTYNASESTTDVFIATPDITDGETYKIVVWADGVIPLINSINDLNMF